MWAGPEMVKMIQDYKVLMQDIQTEKYKSIVISTFIGKLIKANTEKEKAERERKIIPLRNCKVY